MLDPILVGIALAALAAMLIAGLVHGMLGVGFPMVATPIIALATDVRTAILLTLIPTLVVNVITVFQGGRWGESVGRFWPTAVLVLIGSALGSQLLVRFDPAPFKLILAGVIFFYLYSRVLRKDAWSWIGRFPVASGIGFGAVGGLVAGTSNVAVPVLIIYFTELNLTTVALVQVLNLCFLAGKVAQIGVYSLSGHLSADVLLASAPLAAVAVGALLVGNRLRRAVARDTYMRWLRRLLLVIGISLTVQTVFWAL
jgi:uncharacterized membrane protein YfcA